MYFSPLFAADFLRNMPNNPHRNIDLSSTEGKHPERMIGYPALIAFVKLFFGGVWATAIIAIQSLFSLLATVLLFLGGLTSNDVQWLGFVRCFFATPPPRLFNGDSILGSLMTVLTSSLVLIMFGRPFAFTLGFLPFYLRT